MLKKAGMFVLSLWLLFVLIIIITIDIPVCFGDSCEFVGVIYLLKNNYMSLISIIALFIGGLSYYDFVYKVKGTPELSFEILEIESIEYEHLSFLATYIIPLVTFNFLDLRYQIVFFFLLFVIGAIYIKTDLFYVNPTLSILRFRIYKINGKFLNGDIRESKILITRDCLLKNDRVQYIKFDERIYFARKCK
jgi:hypothetical protein